MFNPLSLNNNNYLLRRSSANIILDETSSLNALVGNVLYES
jgi:hypothetical protein